MSREVELPTAVLPIGSTRSLLPQICREFAERGASAPPVFFGAHRKTVGVMLSYERYVTLLDLIDNLAIVVQVQHRDATDTGERPTLDEVIASQGFDRSELEGEIKRETPRRKWWKGRSPRQ